MTTNEPQCTCFTVPEERWTKHYDATEPGSMVEPNPDCPVHFPKAPEPPLFGHHGNPDKLGGHPLPARSYTEVGDILTNLSTLFIRTRERRRMTIRQVAAEMDVASSTVSRIEIGGDPSIEVAVKALEWMEQDCPTCLGDAHDAAPEAAAGGSSVSFLSDDPTGASEAFKRSFSRNQEGLKDLLLGVLGARRDIDTVTTAGGAVILGTRSALALASDLVAALSNCGLPDDTTRPDKTEPATLEIEPSIGGLAQVDVSGWPADVPHVWLGVESYAHEGEHANVVLHPDEARQIGEALIAAANDVERIQPTTPSERWG